MRPIQLFGHLMSSTVTVADLTGNDAFGQPTYGSPRTYRAHLSRKRRFVQGKDMRELLSSQAVYLMTADPVDVTALVTLSTADVGSTELSVTQPVVVAVERRFDQRGPHHTVVYFG